MDVTTTDKTSEWDSVDLKIERAGEKIVLPNTPKEMTTAEGIKALERILQAEETVFAVNETVPCHFYDGMVAFARALQHKYGYSMSKPTPGFFGSRPPQLVNVRVGHRVEDTVQVPFGSFAIPNIEGVLTTGYGLHRGIPALVISGKVKAKEKHIVMEIVSLTMKFSREKSIYRGKSIILERDERNGINFDEPLGFFDPNTGSEEPIFNAETQQLIDTAVMAPITRAEECRKHKIPLKRGILFEGPYGCGKSLVSRNVAKVANENGWTFILVKSAQSLTYALTFAKMYQPCVVFAEDIDRLAGERNEGANDLINEIDGVVGKNDEIMIALTTNFAHKIDKAFMRPGRLDAIVSIRPPHGEAVERLVRHYAGSSLDKDADLSEVVEKLSGQIPAVIREVVERSKLFMLFNGHDNIKAADILTSALSIGSQLELAANAREGQAEVDPLAAAFSKAITPVVESLLDAKLAKLVEDHL